MPMEITEMRDVRYWAPSVGMVRDAIMASRLCMPDYGVMSDKHPDVVSVMPSTEEFDRVDIMARAAVMAGRLLDFGTWNNAAIMAGGKRGGPLWNQQAIRNPFHDPWVFMHSWDIASVSDDLDPGQTCAVSVYLVVPNPHGQSMWIIELQPNRFNGIGLLELGDRVLLYVQMDNRTEYRATISPSAGRIMVALHKGHDMQQVPIDAAGNVIDPTMLAMLMLNTRNVEREVCEVPVKVNRARMKAGKPALPSHEKVFSQPYITALTTNRAQAHGEAQGGTHRSPIPHIRRGHFRDYKSGVQAFIQDTLVMVPAEQRADWKAGRRSHYEVRP